MEEYYYNLTHDETTFLWTLVVVGIIFFGKKLADILL